MVNKINFLGFIGFGIDLGLLWKEVIRGKGIIFFEFEGFMFYLRS